MNCEFYEHCGLKANDDLCNEVYEYCLIRKKLKQNGVRMSNGGIEEEVLDMIQLNGYIVNPRWNEGKVV